MPFSYFIFFKELCSSLWGDVAVVPGSVVLVQLPSSPSPEFNDSGLELTPCPLAWSKGLVL